MNILMPVCMGYAEESMNVVWRNVFEIEKALVAAGHTVCWFSIIAKGSNGKHKKDMDKRLATAKNKKWDVILVHYSSWYVHKDAAEQLIRDNPEAAVGWVTTDYEINRHGAFNPYHFVISNFDESFYEKRKKFYDRYLFSNLNCLIYDGMNEPVEKKYDALYYGRYRSDREDYFKKYFDGTIAVSTSKVNVKYFKMLGCKSSNWIDKISWSKGHETLNLFKTSLYIEDKTTHKYFNNLANRFYEGLMCRAVPMIDANCVNTFKKSGYQMDENLVIESSAQIPDVVRYSDQCAGLLETWDQTAKEEKKKTIAEIVSFIESYG